MASLQQMFVRAAKDLDEQEVVMEGASRLKIQYLIDAPEAKGFVMRRFILKKDGHTSLHKHKHEQEFYVLRGKGEVTDGAMTLPLKKDTVVYVPPMQKHQLRNTGRGSLILLSVEDLGSLQG